MSEKGTFVISLDFELMWGVRDILTIDQYGQSILAVQEILPRMLEMFKKYNIEATFATVGFLFASNKNELLEFCPNSKPQYDDKNLSPYNGHFDLMKDSENEDKYHYASELIDLLKQYPEQEIGTHTFSHYYCNSKGQSVEEFADDMNSAIKIANAKEIELKSLIFPRNMVNEDCLKVCDAKGIKSYRGNEPLWFHKEELASKAKTLLKRAFRLLNAYINLSGHIGYKTEDVAKEKPYNIPSSRFLRPFSNTLSFLEGIRKKRILKSMTHAAKNGLIFHLWWHPHNFGSNQDENFAFLEDLLVHYKGLNDKYGFTSMTMGRLANKLDTLHE